MNRATKPTTTLYFSGVGDGWRFLGLDVENQAQAEKLVGRRIGVVTAQASAAQIAKIKKAEAQDAYYWVEYELWQDGTGHVRIQTSLHGDVRLLHLDGSVQTFTAQEWEDMSVRDDGIDTSNE